MKLHLTACFLVVALFMDSFASAALPNELERTSTLSLNGDWRVACIKENAELLHSTYTGMDSPISNWMHTEVPGNSPLPYMQELKPDDGAYIQYYRRDFRIPDDWKDRNIFLQIDGVLSSYRVWVDGAEVRKVDGHLGICQFDITDSLRYDDGEVHVIVVRVDPSAHQNSCCLYRDISLLALPQRFLSSVRVTTDIDPSTSTAKLNVQTYLRDVRSATDWSDASLSLELFDPQGESVAQTTITWFELQNGRAVGRAILPVAHPLLWTAETPHLYRLVSQLNTAGRPVYRSSQQVGLRRFRAEKGILTLNGFPIELRGIVYNEWHPDAGFALQEERWNADLQHVKNGNINAIRIVNGSPHPRFLDICDEMGFYAIYDLPFRVSNDAVFSSIQRLIEQDGSHPCVLAWNLTGRTAWNEELNQVSHFIKALDPSILLMAEGLFDSSLPDVVDILAPLSPDLNELERLNRSNRPIVAVAHSPAVHHSLEGLQDFQRLVRDRPFIAGGMLQQFADDPPQDDGSTPVGILNADRTSRIDFWQTRRVYAPVRIEEEEAKVKPGKQAVELTLANHYDFTNLREIDAQWFLLRNGQSIMNRSLLVDLEPRRKMDLAAVVDIPDDLADNDYALQFQFSDPKSGRLINESVVRLRQSQWQKDFVMRLRDLEWDEGWKVTADPLRAQIDCRDFSSVIQLATPGWFMRTQEHGVRLITDGPYILLATEFVVDSRENLKASLHKDFWIDSKTMDKVGKNVEIQTHFMQTNPIGDPVQAQIDVLSSPFGYYDIRFSIDPGSVEPLQQVGLSFLVPSTMKEIAWLGKGPSPSYPGQTALSSWGAFRFPIESLIPGNRSQVDFLSMRDAKGYGLGIVLIDGDASINPVAEGTWITVNAAVAGLGNGAWETRYPILSENNRDGFSAAFRLIPLIRNKYPQAFERLWK